jgi:hypothetical protein
MMSQTFTLKSSSGSVSAIYFPVKLCNPLDESFHDVTALLDTGADVSCVSSQVVSLLSLQAIGKSFTRTASGFIPVTYHYINIVLPKGIVFNNLLVSEFTGAPSFDMLIGMDIIAQGDLAITSENGNTVVSFRKPHGVPHIDFAVKTPRGLPRGFFSCL